MLIVCWDLLISIDLPTLSWTGETRRKFLQAPSAVVGISDGQSSLDELHAGYAD